MIPTKQTFLQSDLYLAVGADVMIKYNLWIDVGLKNGAKSTVIDFV